ncbi:MAG: hypothetical protein AAF267_19660 [Deinococcota bacterium]
MTKTTRYQVKDTLHKRGKHRTLLGVDPLTGLPVLIYVFPDRPRVTVGRLESDAIPSILAARYNSEKTMGQVVVAHSDERQTVTSVASKEDALSLLIDTAKALAAATHAKVIHGDISPSRFMVEGDHYLLEGYGINWPAQDARFAPPEGGVSLKGDIFSWGQSVYDLAGHILPRAVTKLVATCLADDPEKRPAAPKLLSELEELVGESASEVSNSVSPQTDPAASPAPTSADDEFMWPGAEADSTEATETSLDSATSMPDTAGSFGDLDFELDFKDDDIETFQTTAHAAIESGERLADFDLDGLGEIATPPPSFLDDETASASPLAQTALEVTPIPESRADDSDSTSDAFSSADDEFVGAATNPDDINFVDTPPQPVPSTSGGASGLSDLSDILPSSSSSPTSSAASGQPSPKDTMSGVLTAPTTDGTFVKGLPTGAKVRTVESKKKSSSQDAAASQKFPKNYSPTRKQKPQRSWRPVWMTILLVGLGVLIYIVIEIGGGGLGGGGTIVDTTSFYPLNVNIRPNRISQAQLVVVASPEGSVHEPGDEVATVPARIFLDREGVWQVRARFRNNLSDVQTITVPQTGAITLEIPLPEDDPELQ